MKFKIKNLAKIKEATFDIKNLTILVGKNSTNKTYVAHTAYMLNKIFNKFNLKNKYILESFSNSLSKNPNKLKTMLIQIKSFKKSVTLVEEESLWGNTKEVRQVKYIFDVEVINTIIHDFVSALNEIIINEVNKSFNINKQIAKNIIFNTLNIEKINIYNNNQIIIQSDKEDSDSFALLRYIWEEVSQEYFKQKISYKTYYFPASRTGFVLTFDEIVSGVLRDRFGGQPTATKLTEPTIDFISDFSDIKSGKFDSEIIKLRNLLDLDTEDSMSNKHINTLLKFIEKRIIKGKIVEEKKEENYTQFYLKPKDSQKLELHLTSSATVEMLPLVIFLKHFSKLEDKFLVIEEPEAHLHPQAQIEMARLLVMLVNAGAKVLVTTHSDYILNEISNCIKLAEADSKNVKKYLNEYKLNQDIIINKDRVSAYLFKDTDDNVEVKALEIDEYGISNDNFDDVLDELLDRTEEINNFIEPKFN